MPAMLYNQGPLSISVDAESWQYYLGGIIQYHCTPTYLNHAVQIVGFDMSGGLEVRGQRSSWVLVMILKFERARLLSFEFLVRQFYVRYLFAVLEHIRKLIFFFLYGKIILLFGLFWNNLKNVKLMHSYFYRARWVNKNKNTVKPV